MPSDEEALNYFKIYFRDIHPYVPVIHRSHFYWQWENDRDSISPLLLESLFASAGRFSDSPAQSAQWLALANKHESSFMDVPRLSTIQALLLLLKARESTPKKGYYYRSWQAVKTMISMSKDLDIHEHYGTHAEGKPCVLDPVKCLEQTRIWQTLLVVEAMDVRITALIQRQSTCGRLWTLLASTNLRSIALNSTLISFKMRATFASLQTFFIRLSEMRIGLPTLDSWQIARFLPTGFATCPRTCRSTIPQMVHHLGYHHILWLTCIATAIWELSDCTARSYLPRSPLPEEIGKCAWLYAIHLLRKFVAFKRLF